MPSTPNHDASRDILLPTPSIFLDLMETSDQLEQILARKVTASLFVLIPDMPWIDKEALFQNNAQILDPNFGLDGVIKHIEKSAKMIASSNRPQRIRFSPKHRQIMRNWFDKHIDDPV